MILPLILIVFESSSDPTVKPAPMRAGAYPQLCSSTGQCCPGDLQCTYNVDTDTTSACCPAGDVNFCNGACCNGTCIRPHGPPANYTCCESP